MPDTMIGAEQIAQLAPARKPRRKSDGVALAAFAEQVVAAVLPLVDPEDKEQLREDVGDAEVYAAVKPIFADYTVGDAVGAYSAIEQSVDSSAPDRFTASFYARDALENFISRGRATSPACATARVNFLLEQAGECITDNNMPLLYEAIAQDIWCLRNNDFRSPNKKRRFGGAKWHEID